MPRWFLVICLAAFSVGSAMAQSSDEQRSRDLSNMFYNDTLPPKPEPAKPQPAKKPVARKPAAKPSPERRMGIKYRILLRTPDCDIREVDPSYTFHSGDKVRLQFEANVDGYLYVLQKGSTGKDHTLFPDPRINGGNNKINRGILYSVPASQWFTFDNNPGIEVLTVALTRTPMKSVPQSKPATSPAAAKASDDEGNVSVVSVVEELNQNVRPRDLVFVQEKAPVVQSSAEPVAAATQSTIVINTKQDNNNAVYTEIKLKHD